MHLLNSVCIGFVVLCTAFVSCSNEKADPEKSRQTVNPEITIHQGGVYRYPLGHNPSTLDPAYVQDMQGTTIVHQVFDRLIQFGPYLGVLPALAESWRMEEGGMTYRFFLRTDVRFHNGNQMDVYDVIFSIKRLIRAEPPSSILPHLLKIKGAQLYRDGKTDELAGMEAITKHTLLVRLFQPHVPLLIALGSYQASIVPKNLNNMKGDGYSRHPVGTGPFKMASWEPNSHVKLEKFPDYYGGSAFLDAIEYRIYPGAQINEMISDFREKKIEEVPAVGNIEQRLGGNEHYSFYQRPALNLFFYGINCQHGNLSSIELRKALFQSLDRHKLVHDVYNNRFEIAHSILPPGMPGYQPAQLSDNGLVSEKTLEKISKSNITLEIASSINSPNARAELDFVRRSWAKIGIQLKVKYITDWKEFNHYIKSDAVQIYRYDWTADMPDPDSFLYPLFASGSPVNYMRYINDHVDTMLIHARGITNPLERAALYQKIEKQIMAEMPLIPLVNLSVNRIYQPYVQGVMISALGIQRTLMHRVWLSEPVAQ